MTLDEIKQLTSGLLDFEVVKYEAGRLDDGRAVMHMTIVQSPSKIATLSSVSPTGKGG